MNNLESRLKKIEEKVGRTKVSRKTKLKEEVSPLLLREISKFLVPFQKLIILIEDEQEKFGDPEVLGLSPESHYTIEHLEEISNQASELFELLERFRDNKG